MSAKPLTKWEREQAEIDAADAKKRLAEAAPNLLEALRALVAACDTISPLSGDYGRATVKAVRIAGKFMAAVESANAAIAKAEGSK